VLPLKTVGKDDDERRDDNPEERATTQKEAEDDERAAGENASGALIAYLYGYLGIWLGRLKRQLHRPAQLIIKLKIVALRWAGRIGWAARWAASGIEISFGCERAPKGIPQDESERDTPQRAGLRLKRQCVGIGAPGGQGDELAGSHHIARKNLRRAIAIKGIACWANDKQDARQ